MADDDPTVTSQCKGGRCGRRGRTKQPTLVDSISSLPDDILQHILSFIPTKFAIRTSVLSKRWRHIWCNTPSLSFECTREPAWINETLNRYTALKMMSFHLSVYNDSIDDVNRWIEFAMSRNLENISIKFRFESNYAYITPTFSVSWTSLKKFSLHWCKLPDDSITKILSGCPILQSLTLDYCKELTFLDLSKCPCLRTLRVEYNVGSPGPTEIVAPHIHCLKLMSSSLSPCTLLDVTSLTEAKLDICNCFVEVDAYFLLQFMVLQMLEKLQNVEKLTLTESVLQILSLAEIRGAPFPMFKVKAMTLKTEISPYVIPGIQRMLQNSPDLKKITVHLSTCNNKIPEWDFNIYVRNLISPDQSWRVPWNKDRADVKSNHVVLFMELMLENAEALEKLVVKFQDRYHKFKELVPRLPNKKNVSIVLSTKPSKIDVTGES